MRRSRTRFRNDKFNHEPERGEAPAYQGVGADLKAERERQGRGLTDVAGALRIQQHYLEAIEAGRFDDLPGSTYVTGFLRSYSRLLGIDAAEVIAAFRREATMPLGPTKLVAPEPIAEPRRPRATVVLVSLLAAAVLYAGWSYLNDDTVDIVAAVAPAPDRLLGLLRAENQPAAPAEPEVASLAGEEAAVRDEAPVQAAVERRTAIAMSDAAAAAREAQRDANAMLDPPAPLAPAATEPAPPTGEPAQPKLADRPALAEAPGEAGEDTPPETPALANLDLATSAPAIPQPPPDTGSDTPTLPPPPPSVGSGSYVPQRYGSGEGDARVVVRAKVDSWVQIQGARNETLLTRILRPGDTFYAPNRSDLLLTTGNVGGLEIIVDGAPLGPLGPMGAVRRNISLDAERLLAMAGGREQQR